jgi:hypothetical protein
LHIYVVKDQAAKPPSPTAADILRTSTYLLQFVQITSDNQTTSAGSVHSSSLKGKDAAALPLGSIRSWIDSMYVDV